MCNKLDCPYRKNSLCRANGTEKDVPTDCPAQMSRPSVKNNKPRTVRRNPAKRGKI